MIDVTIQDLVKSVSVLNKIMEQPFHGSLAFKLSRIIREVRRELETYEEERKKILSAYGEKDESGNLVLDERGNVKIIPQFKEACQLEFDKLLKTQIVLNVDKIESNELDEFQITPKEMEDLLVFFMEQRKLEGE